MPETGSEIIKRYLVDAIAAEKSFESQLRTFAAEGDDAEVQGLFLEHAAETKQQYERLTARLEEMGGTPSASKSVLAHLFSLAPRVAQATHQTDERLAQNLIMAFSVESSECAMYEALIAVARRAGDIATEVLARDIQKQEQATAEKVWRFIPSRSKIAYNVLTAGELDPAVETRVQDNPIL